MIGGSRISCTYVPTRNQLTLRVYSRPSPNVAEAELSPLPLGNILIFRVDEAPNFIGLELLAVKVSEGLVLVLGASRSHVYQELGNSINGNVGYPRCSPNDLTP